MLGVAAASSSLMSQSKRDLPIHFLPARVATKEVTLLSPVLMAVAILAVKDRKRPLRDGHVLSAFKSSTRNRGRIAASRTPRRRLSALPLIAIQTASLPRP